MINLTEDDIRSLQTIENSVYGAILGAPDYAPNSTLRCEIGASLMKTRIINTRINYMKRMCEKNKLLGLILHNLVLEQNTKWIKVSMKYLDEVKLHIGDVETKSKREIKQICTIWDNEQWKSDINSKSTLKVYRHHKQQIQEEHIYKNHPSSVIWYKVGLSRFTHVTIRFDSIQLGHDPIDSIRFTIHSFRPIRLKFLTQSAI